MLSAAHKPGAIPLRPLRLGDLYDGAFKIIRFNPRATVGSAVIVTTIAMLLPLLVTAVLTYSVGLSAGFVAGDPSSAGRSEVLGLVGAYGAVVLGSVLQWLGMVFVTGMNAHVAAAAAVGRRLSLAESWDATRGKRWRLLGMIALLALAYVVLAAVLVGAIVVLALTLDTLPAVLLGILLGLVLIAGSAFFWIRVTYLAVPPLMLEPIGTFAALGRAWTLSRRQFWRIFGIAVLTLVITNIVGGVLALPVTAVGQFLLFADPAGTGVLAYVACTALASVLSAALVTPFLTTVTSLQYLDQRIRKEGYDVELIARAGIAPR